MTGIIHLLVTLIQVYSWLILARIILSWIPNVDRSHAVVAFLYQITEPVLEPARRVIPPLGMIDISPLVVFIALHLLQGVLRSAASGM